MKASLRTKLLQTVSELKRWRLFLSYQEEPANRPMLGFVPTMGALHDGHLSLIQAASAGCRHVLVSIFVNPLQFGAGEDLERYPRPFEKDMDLCRQAGVSAVFHPSPAEIYRQGQDAITRVIPPKELIGHLCGAFRPGHFEGVATVVAKLFGLVEPDVAYFGEKDYQQLTVVRRMVIDLDMPVTIVGVPTGREPDGLAMSSRNAYLDKEQRRLAPALYETLCYVRDQAVSGRLPLAQALAEGRARLSRIPGVTLEYLEACRPDTLRPLAQFEGEMVVLVAAKFGDVRLIDNVIGRA